MRSLNWHLIRKQPNFYWNLVCYSNLENWACKTTYLIFIFYSVFGISSQSTSIAKSMAKSDYVEWDIFLKKFFYSKVTKSCLHIPICKSIKIVIIIHQCDFNYSVDELPHKMMPNLTLCLFIISNYCSKMFLIFRFNINACLNHCSLFVMFSRSIQTPHVSRIHFKLFQMQATIRIYF